MKKFLLLIGGLIALIVLLVNIGPLILFVIAAWLLYLIIKQFIQTDSTLAKIGWIILGLIVIMIGLPSSPVVIGLVALVVLYYIYKSWNETKEETVELEQDPFINFEQQWHDLSK